MHELVKLGFVNAIHRLGFFLSALVMLRGVKFALGKSSSAVSVIAS
jgi:hypothetical protein